jgi:hypothetical protein
MTKHVLNLLNPPNMADKLLAPRGNLLLPFQFVCNERTGGEWDLQLMPVRDANNRIVQRRASPEARTEPEPLWRNCLDRASKVRSTMRLDHKEAVASGQATDNSAGMLFREFEIRVKPEDAVTGLSPFSLTASLVGAHRFSQLMMSDIPGYAATVDSMLALMCSNSAVMAEAKTYDRDIDLSKMILENREVPHGILPIPGTNAGWAHFHPWLMVFGGEDFLTSPLPSPNKPPSDLPSFIVKDKSMKDKGQHKATPLGAILRWLRRSDAFLVNEKLEYIRRAQSYPDRAPPEQTLAKV